MSDSKCSRWTAIAVIFFGVIGMSLRFPVYFGDIRESVQVIATAGVVFSLSAAIWRCNRTAAVFFALLYGMTWYPRYDGYSEAAFRAVFMVFVWFLVLVTTCQRRHIRWMLIAVAGINVLAALMQATGTWALWKSTNSGVVGLMTNKNELDAMLVFCLPVFLQSRDDLLSMRVFPYSIFFIPAIIGVLAVNHSAATVVSFAAVGLVLAWLFLPARTSVLLSIMALAGSVLAYLNLSTDMGIRVRINVWISVFKVMLYRAAYWGQGLGHWYSSDIQVEGIGRMENSHNEYFQAFFELGAQGLAVVTALVLSTIRSFRRLPIEAVMALTAVMANSLVNYPFHCPPTAMVAVAWFAYAAQGE